MQRALVLARRGWGQTAPNPMVGAVVVRGNQVVGEGWHARYGGAHAEVKALAAAGRRARGATLYVTLEPCAHHGKTPPCADAIVEAGIGRVVCAVADPNPKAGGGARRLRRAGIDVEFGLEAAAARELNAAFFFAHENGGRPWVTLKLAMSVDGAVAGPRGRRVAITGLAASRAVHRLRAGADAIAIGIGTALADDPALTVRLGRAPRVAPARVVFDRGARLPPTGRLVRMAEAPTVAFVGPGAPAARARALAARGVEVLPVSSLRRALQVLSRRGVRSLLVEGGPTLAAALLAARLVDRIVIFRSPRRLGPGAIAAFDDASFLDRFREVARRRYGRDVMTTYDAHQGKRRDVHRTRQRRRHD